MNISVIATYLIFFCKKTCLPGKWGRLARQLKGLLSLRLSTFFVPTTMKQLLLLFGIMALSWMASAQTTNNCNFSVSPEMQAPSCAGTEDGVIRLNLDNPLGLLLTYKWTKLLGIVPLPLPSILSNVATGLSGGDYQVIVSNGLCSDTLNINLPEPAPIQILDTALCGIGGIINLKDRIRGGNGDYRITANSLLGNTINCNDCEDPSINIDKLSVLNVLITDRKGCQTQRQMAIEVLDSLKAFATVVDETCTENGAITVRASGGSGTYRYALQNITSNTQAESTFRGLAGNRTYTVHVQDNKFCRTQENVFVQKRPTNTQVALQTQDVSCYGAKDGFIRVQPNTTNSRITGYALNSLTATAQNQPEFRNLRSDAYVVYVLEGEDCYVPYKVNINEPDSMTLNASATDANCPGSSDGVVLLQANGGNNEYQYSIDGVRFQNNNRFVNLDAGTYPAFARDRKGCTASTSFLVDEPEPPGIGTDVTASCTAENTGSIVVVDIGDWLEGEYRFSLDSTHWQTNKIFSGLAPGTYTVYVQDPNGCVFTVTAIVPAIAAPGVFFKTQQPSCPDAENGVVTVEVTTNGNTQDYFYSINGEQFTPNNTLQNLAAGDYQLFIRDSFNCLFTYPFTIEAAEAPNILLTSEAATCFDGKNGKVKIQTQGGKAPFTYALNGIQFQPNPVFDGLGASTYLAIVRDANGCLFANEVSVAQPAAITAHFTSVDETCNNSNGAIACQPSGGTAPYRYRWDLGDTIAVITNLQAGNYRVSISDANNCLIVANETLQNLPGPIVIGDLTQAPCHGTPKGAIELSVFGGSQPFRYLWSNGSSMPQLHDLQAGNYTVTVTDKNQCTSIKTFNLYEPAPIELQSQTGMSNGLYFVNLICNGGAQPYQYQWSNGETTEDLFNLKAATYSVTVTDQQGCTQVHSVTVGTTALQEPEWAKSVKIFPNPATETIYILIEAARKTKTTLQLLDATGKNVLAPTVMQDDQTHLPVAHLPKGVYVLRLARAEGMLHRKIVVQ